MHFLMFFRYFQISFSVKSFRVHQVLSKILKIDWKTYFNVFMYILNQCYIFKIEKISDGMVSPEVVGRATLGA